MRGHTSQKTDGWKTAWAERKNRESRLFQHHLENGVASHVHDAGFARGKKRL